MNRKTCNIQNQNNDLCELADGQKMFLALDKKAVISGVKSSNHRAVQQLPMEFLVKMQKLISIRLNGGVG